MTDSGRLLHLLSLLLVPICCGWLSSACSSDRGIRKPPEFKILQTSLGRQIDFPQAGSSRDETGTPVKTDPLAQTDPHFSTREPEIISHIRYANLAGTHQLRWEWYDPRDRLYKATGNHTISSSPGKYIEKGSSWHRISVKGTGAGQHPGRWKVKIFLDNLVVATDPFTLVPVMSDIDFGSYHALAIGNNTYRSLPKLKTPGNDVQAIARLLEKDYGFAVEVLEDASRSDVILSLERLRQRLTSRDNLLIYYAGHGSIDREEDEGYWLPVDAARDDKTNWISNSAITSSLKAIKAKHILVVADSCYSGKLTRGGENLHVRMKELGYYYQMSRKQARVVLSSGGLEPVVDTQGTGSHSVFASAFVRVLEENEAIMDGTLLFNQIRRIVVLSSDQTPEYSDIRKSGHDGGDFLFIRKF